MMHDPEQNSGDFQEFEPQQTEPHKKRSVFFIVLLCLIFFFGGCMLTRALFAPSLPEDPTAYDPITLEPKKPKGIFNRLRNLVLPPEQALEKQKDERVNILILGQGGPGHEGPYLTDTIILASINTQTKQVGFVSLPRDLIVNIPDLGQRKINSANSIGETKQKGFGAAFATNVIQKTLDIEIPYYVLVDFKAFKEVIDSIGGIDIHVDKAFTDDQYPVPGKEDALPVSSRYKVLSFSAGKQHMSGQTALEFIRSRHGNNGEGSDFARSKRQQKVMVATKEKILSAGTLLNPIRLNEIYNSLQNNISTNLEFSEMISFLKLSREFDTQNVFTLTLDTSPNGFLKEGYGQGGAYILQPKTGNFDAIRAAIQNIFQQNLPQNTQPLPGSNSLPSSQKPQPSTNTSSNNKPTTRTMNIEIKNGTWTEGLALRVKNELMEKNIVVNSIANTQQRPRPKSGIYVLTQTPSLDTVQLLQSTLQIPVQSSPSGETPATGTDILVILGEDYKE